MRFRRSASKFGTPKGASNDCKKQRENNPADDGYRAPTPFDMMTPAQLAAWQAFCACPVCGNPKAVKYKTKECAWTECGKCGYYLDKNQNKEE